jgi:hypothetical protein
LGKQDQGKELQKENVSDTQFPLKSAGPSMATDDQPAAVSF